VKKILKTFDYENLLIKEYDHWYLLLRKKQVTLGSMILIEKDFKKKYGDISLKSHVEFGLVVKEIEDALKSLFCYDKINYLMLMMVDPEVHYHVLPRYSKNVIFDKIKFIDTGWPSLPDLNFVNDLKKDTEIKLINSIKFKISQR
jgi:diadenosine tetraphosphate (Ap4A) HIT family hydrolase